MSCDIPTMLDEAKCIQFCVPDGMNMPVVVSLFCQIMVGHGAPTNPDIAANSTDGNLIITWTNAGTPDTNEVWVSRNGGAYSLLTTVGGGVSQAIDSTAMVDLDQWTYKIRSIKNGIHSPFTSTVSALKNFTGTAVQTSFVKPDLVFVVGALIFTNCNSLTIISAPLLHTITSTFGVNGATSLTAINLPKLSKVIALDVTIVGALNSLTSIDLSSLVSCGGNLAIDNTTALTSVNLPSLQTLGQNFEFIANTVLQTISAPILSTVGGQVDLQSNANLASFSAPLLSSTGLDLFVNGNGSLTSLSLPSLTSIGLQFTMNTNVGLTSISLPLLATIGFGPLDLSGNPALTVVTLTSLTKINGTDITMTPSPALTTFSIPVLKYTDNSVLDWTGDALLVASVNQILARGVASGVVSCDFELIGGTNAPPAGQGLIDKAALITAGNIVNTN